MANSTVIISNDIQARLKEFIETQNKYIIGFNRKINVEGNPRLIDQYKLEIEDCQERKKIFKAQINNELIQRNPNTDTKILEEKLEEVIRKTDKYYVALSEQLSDLEQNVLKHFDKQFEDLLIPQLKDLSESQKETTEVLLKDFEQINHDLAQNNEFLEFLSDKLNDLDITNKNTIKEQLNNADIAVRHRIKVAIPLLLPFISYESELELGATEKMPRTWKEFRALVFKKKK